ncbi:MAG: ribonuclease HI [Myxococcota bacterium]
MRWIKARFKDADVWAEIDAAGKPVVKGGRRAIKYKEAPGAKVYSATASGVVDGTEVIEDPGGGAAGGFGKAGTRTAAQTAAAATDAKARLAALPEGTVVAFSDGACTGNPGPAGSGAVVKLPDGRVLERHRALGLATNNIGELTAVRLALELLDEAGVAKDAPVALFTDSKYAIGVLTQGWKAQANRELIAELKRALAARPLSMSWVAGHAGIPLNERADELARRGVRESMGEMAEGRRR